MPVPIRNEELMARFSKKDAQAFRQVHGLYDKALYYYAFKRTRDVHVSEDIVSECFLKLWISSAQFERLPALRDYLYRMASHAVMDHFRKERRKQALNRALTFSREYDDLEEDERAKIEAEVLRELHAKVESIPGKAGEVFRMYFFEQMNTRQIAGRMGVAEQTILNHKMRAVKYIRGIFMEKDMLFILIAHSLLTGAGINIFV